MICVELIEGCENCAKEAEYLASVNHECTPMCELLGRPRHEDEEYHRLSHEPARCESCKMVVDDHRGYDVLVSGRCPAGWCNEFNCPFCGAKFCSEGPVDCPTCGSLTKARKAQSRLSRVRQAYHRRRRYW